MYSGAYIYRDITDNQATNFGVAGSDQKADILTIIESCGTKTNVTAAYIVRDVQSHIQLFVLGQAIVGSYNMVAVLHVGIKNNKEELNTKCHETLILDVWYFIIQ